MARPQRQSNQFTKILSDRLSDLMNDEQEKTKLKQEEICKKIGVAPGSYSEWASDKKTPTVDKLALIAKYFDVSTDWLLGLSDTPSRDKDVARVCDYTGLPEEAVKRLHELCIEDGTYSIPLTFVYYFLTHSNFEHFKNKANWAVLSEWSYHKFILSPDSDFDRGVKSTQETYQRLLDEVTGKIAPGGRIEISAKSASALYRRLAQHYIDDVFEDTMNEAYRAAKEKFPD